MCKKCNVNRDGHSWDKFLEKYKLKNICDDGNGVWTVESASGGTYSVVSKTRIERHTGSMYFVIECNCPARKSCRHIEAVTNMRRAEELLAAQSGDNDGMEILERTE
ncbi:MAG: hypothetical protein KGJ09_10515 [Candidatus Omnitrophica bacterium]|nr:hypothetical protein [Candidatus Omnitrophota bacterium]